MGKVNYRGNSLDDVVLDKTADLVIFSKLMLMHECYPALMKKRQIPIGVRTSSNMHLCTRLVHAVYPSIDWNGDSVCLHLMCCLLHCDQMFLHTQKGLVVVSVGGERQPLCCNLLKSSLNIVLGLRRQVQVASVYAGQSLLEKLGHLSAQRYKTRQS